MCIRDRLVRDTSKKIKAVKKSKGMSGKPVTSKPVYGYLMDEDENFIIDEEAAPVVKQIYRLCLAGNGPTKIARMPVSYTHLCYEVDVSEESTA